MCDLLFRKKSEKFQKAFLREVPHDILKEFQRVFWRFLWINYRKDSCRKFFKQFLKQLLWELSESVCGGNSEESLGSFLGRTSGKILEQFKKSILRNFWKKKNLLDYWNTGGNSRQFFSQKFQKELLEESPQIPGIFFRSFSKLSFKEWSRCLSRIFISMYFHPQIIFAFLQWFHHKFRSICSNCSAIFPEFA